MTELERKILAYIGDRSIPGQFRPTTTEIYREFGRAKAEHALGMLQCLGHVGVCAPRQLGKVKRYEIKEPGIQALKRVAA